ncbi:hypothetical protein GCM10009779_64810 [Polymorphospora rubra]|uniref:DUF2637 domain-containing protein n=2 Tax=Polymorphospora rubra TaxID=338584 RepID=A0A810N0G9_9ACTN|nr:hypothetical protein Prubr_21060 [Polymorphospora rubra]
MKWRRKDPISAAAAAQARAVESAARVEQAKHDIELRRLQVAADREAARERQADEEADAERQAGKDEKAREKRREKLRNRLAALRPVAPLIVVNGVAVYGQVQFAYHDISHESWSPLAKLGLAVAFATAVESISVYVGWHAHDSLLLKDYAGAARLRRYSYLIAMVVAGINYWHFAGEDFFGLAPTPAALTFGLLSGLSPWLWGLHTRRAQRVQLIAESPTLIDEAGAEFSRERRRAFPLRTYQARRWSIDHGIRDPRKAWEGYNAERRRARAQRPAGRIRVAATILRGKPVNLGPAWTDVDDATRNLCDGIRLDAQAARANVRRHIDAGLGFENPMVRIKPTGPIRVNATQPQPTREPLPAAERAALPAPPVPAEPTGEPAQVRTDEPSGNRLMGWLKGRSRSAHKSAHEPSGEPAQVTHETAQVAAYEPTREPIAEPTSTAHEPAQPVTRESAQPARREPVRAASKPSRKTITEPVEPDSKTSTADRCAAAFPDLVKTLGKRPSGTQLAEKAHVSPAAAKRWLASRKEQ